MRVIGAVRTVPDNRDQRREMLRQADGAQETGNALDLFDIAETETGVGGKREIVAGHRHARDDRLIESLAATVQQIAEPGRRHRLQGHRSQRQRCGERGQKRRGEATVACDAVQALLPFAPPGTTHSMCTQTLGVGGNFVHLVGRRYHHRA